MEIYRKLPLLLEINLVLEVRVGKRKFYKVGTFGNLEKLLHESEEKAQREIREVYEKIHNNESRPDIVYKE